MNAISGLPTQLFQHFSVMIINILENDIFFSFNSEEKKCFHSFFLAGDSIEDRQQSICQRFSRKWHQRWVSTNFNRINCLDVTQVFGMDFANDYYFHFYCVFFSFISHLTDSLCRNYIRNRLKRLKINKSVFGLPSFTFNKQQTFSLRLAVNFVYIELRRMLKIDDCKPYTKICLY